MLRLGWVEGEWALLSGPKILRLIELACELRELRCGYFDVVVCLCGYYKRLSLAVEKGELKFKYASKVLMAIEDFFDMEAVSAYIAKNADRLKPDDFYFMRGRGFIADGV